MSKGSRGIAAIKPDEQWRVESDLDTLMRAEEIEKDPKRLAKAQALAKKRLLELSKVASEGPND